MRFQERDEYLQGCIELMTTHNKSIHILTFDDRSRMTIGVANRANSSLTLPRSSYIICTVIYTFAYAYVQIRANTCKYAHVAAAGLNFYSSYFSIALHTAEQYRGTRIRRIHSANPGEFICSDETEKAIPKKRIFAGNAIRSGFCRKNPPR